MTEKQAKIEFDVLIVGAGFAGLCILYRLREQGFTVKEVDAANDFGGTWYWNRYPGARCDVESLQYSFSFSEQIRKQWKWSERYGSQPEILRYLNFVADELDLRRDIQFKTRVTAAVFDETHSKWRVELDNGEEIDAKFCVMATGCLSIPKSPGIKGIDSFKGESLYTSRWPHEKVEFDGKKVAVIGTGSSAIQIIPITAEHAARLYVFQRTPNFSIPAHNKPLDRQVQDEWKANYSDYQQKIQETVPGSLGKDGRDCSALDVNDEERQKIYEEQWQHGGFSFLAAFNDLLSAKEANDMFQRCNISSIVVCEQQDTHGRKYLGFSMHLTAEAG